MRRAHGVRQRGDGSAVGDVHVVADGANAERLGLARGLGQAGGIDLDQREMAAAARQRERDRPADAAAGAGDDRDPVAQLQGTPRLPGTASDPPRGCGPARGGPALGPGGAPAAPKRRTPSSIRAKRIASMSAR